MDTTDEPTIKEEQDAQTETSAPEEVVSDSHMTDEPCDKDAPAVEELRQLPSSSTKDRTLREFLGMMDQYAPIVGTRSRVKDLLTCVDPGRGNGILSRSCWL